MKLQNLAIIFVILIIPVTLILSVYIGSQIDTASLQQSYDTKLMDATHDAVVAFELNTSNDTYSTTADSIRRDIQASINTFTMSLASGLNIPGANSEYIMPYIPAILVTLYDGYYIYSPAEKIYSTTDTEKTGYAHILKPYVYYSAKYQAEGNENYVVVNYSLDNYVTIYGMINGQTISKSGYLGIDNLNHILNEEDLQEKIVYRTLNGDNRTYTYFGPTNYNYVYYNGKKAYNINCKWYYLNGLDLVKAEPNINKDNSAKNYKESAEKFNDWLKNDTIGKKIVDIVRPQNVRKANGEAYEEFAGNDTKILDITIQENRPEENASEFNQHKREIIKMSIQDNLNNAIAIYNKNSVAMGTNANFKMPKFSETDWEKIITNVNFVTFMQGLPVGLKTYNNYSIVTSTNNKQYVSRDSIYLLDPNTNEYHTYVHALANANTLGTLVGYKSADFIKVRYEKGDDYLYYYRRPEFGDYACIVEPTLESNVSSNSPKVEEVKRSYYTALARERYNLDKVTKLLINY